MFCQSLADCSCSEYCRTGGAAKGNAIASKRNWRRLRGRGSATQWSRTCPEQIARHLEDKAAKLETNLRKKFADSDSPSGTAPEDPGAQNRRATGTVPERESWKLNTT